MKILFLLLQMPEENQGSGMYVDLAQEFYLNGHEITLLAPDNMHKSTYIHSERGMRVVRVDSMATQGQTCLLKKGMALFFLPYYYKKAYDKYLKGECFDWVFMPTPPITLSSFVIYVKRQSKAKFYLILRDIHPQSIYSIGLLKYKWMYNYLDKKAYYGYKQADLIGCMSPANIKFIASNYPDLNRDKLVLLYNWLKSTPAHSDIDIRAKYDIENKFVVLFGGTIGLGQRIENILFLAEHYKNDGHIVFMIIGRGVEKTRLMRIATEKHLRNIRFVEYMPQSEYLNFIKSVDLGLVSINERYTVPTCPSKAVSYMSLGIPIFAMINPNNDYGSIIEQSGAGYWAVGADRNRSIMLFDKIYKNADLRRRMGQAGRRFYMKNCTEIVAYQTMIKQISDINNGI